MLGPELTRERVLLLQRLRELTSARIEKDSARQQRVWKLLEEKNQATVERLARAKIPTLLALDTISPAPSPRRASPTSAKT